MKIKIYRHRKPWRQAVATICQARHDQLNEQKTYSRRLNFFFWFTAGSLGTVVALLAPGSRIPAKRWVITLKLVVTIAFSPYALAGSKRFSAW
jgi:hypothetical protein